MIAHIRGLLIEKSSETVTIDVGGVGYELSIPLSTYYELPELNEALSLSVHTIVKDDTIALYGFISSREKGIFRTLLTVGGIGPKLARNIISGITVDNLLSAISSEDLARLTSVPGLGKKTAQRLIIELKDKVAGLVEEGGEDAVGGVVKDDIESDLLSALTNLGYKAASAESAASVAREALGEGATLEDLLKKSLNVLSSN